MDIDTSINILLVEDSGATRKMEKMILGKLGYKTIIEAEDGSEAIEILQGDQSIDLIISDWNMPGTDGLTLLKWIRADTRRKETPFIMATGQGDRSQAEVARKAGASGMIAKPFSPDELKTVIVEIAEHGSQKEQDISVTREPNVLPDGRVKLSVAHIQITDHLVLGAVKYLIDSGEVQPRHFALETLRQPSWNPVINKLENAEIDGAFVLAPIAMDAFAHGVPIRLVMLAHKNGSIMVRNKRFMNDESTAAFQGKTFYIPHQLSIHHMLSHMYLKKLGLNPGFAGTEGVDVYFEVAPPIKMPEFLANNPNAAGYMVAEPLGTKAIASNTANLQFLSAEAWKDHPCCVVTFRSEITEQYPEAVQEFSSLLVRAGNWIARRPETASEMGVKFLDPEGTLGLSEAVLKNVLTETEGITTNDLYPVIADLDKMNEYMVNEMGIGQRINVNEFVDLRFAEAAYEGRNIKQPERSSLDIETLLVRVQEARSADSMAKVMLNKEGKYLLFDIGDERYGIGIMKMREIVSMQDIHSVPNYPEFVRGVINLRGIVMPVLDLSSWFGYEDTKINDRTPIIIVETELDGEMKMMGILVDAVDEIVDVSAENVESPPSFGDNTRYILAMARIGKGVNILLDVDRICASGLAKVS